MFKSLDEVEISKFEEVANPNYKKKPLPKEPQRFSEKKKGVIV